VADPSGVVVRPADDIVRAQPRTRRFTTSAACSGQVSVFVADCLMGCCEHHRLNRAVRLVDEIVANAVTFARTDLVVTVRTSESACRVEVLDFCPTLPRRCRPDEDSASGSGLALLDRMSSRWGVEPTDHGKVVWFELAERRSPRRTARPSRPSTPDDGSPRRARYGRPQ
jgi:hypothetical protein